MTLTPSALAGSIYTSLPTVLAQVETVESVPGWLYPYGTVFALIGLGIVFWHATTKEDYGIILAGIVWGFMLEQASIAGYETYTYHADAFVLMLLDVPLEIAFTWGGILYTGLKTAEYLGISRRRIPFFVGLFALHLDLALDAVAIRVPYWSWHVQDAAWYGVPLHNFWGWWTVAFLFIGCYFALDRWIDRLELRLVLTLPSALLSFIVGITIWGTLSEIAAVSEIIILAGLVGLSVVLVATDDLDPRPMPWPLVAIPMIIHVQFLFIGFLLGIFADIPVLLGVALLMLALGIALHLVPHWYERRRVGRASA